LVGHASIDNDSDDLDIGAIVGGVVGGLLGLCLLVALVFYCKKEASDSDGKSDKPVPAAALEEQLEKQDGAVLSPQ
jgi:hypothetical protein